MSGLWHSYKGWVAGNFRLIAASMGGAIAFLLASSFVFAVWIIIKGFEMMYYFIVFLVVLLKEIIERRRQKKQISNK